MSRSFAVRPTRRGRYSRRPVWRRAIRSYLGGTWVLLAYVSVAPGSRPLRLLLVAAAGYGKTTALSGAVPEGGLRLTARAALETHLGVSSETSVVGVDDVDELTSAEQEELAGRLAALPPSVGVVLASRRPLHGPARRRLRGHLVEHGPEELRLTAPAVARLLDAEYAVRDPEAAQQLHQLTSGWPLLVHLAAAALVREPGRPVRDVVTGPDSAVASWAADHVLPTLPDGVGTSVGIVAGLGPVATAVLDRVAVALDLPIAAAAAFDDLVASGLLVRSRTLSGRDRHDVVPAVAPALARAAAALSAPRRAAALRAAAAEYEQAHLWCAAARCHAAAGDESEVHRLVRAHGEAMLRQGGAAAVVELLADRSCDGDDLLRRTRADALRLSGEPAAALREFRPLMEKADRDGWTRELATRVGAAHHTLGDYAETLRVLDLARDASPPATEPEVVEELEWRSFRARALVMLGRRAEAEPIAATTLDAAEAVGSPRALAAAHLARARVTDGARKEAHHEQARRAAVQEDDVVTAALVLVNQTYVELAGARFVDAARSGREVVRVAELCCPPGRRVAALHNLGEALTRLGQLDEALWHLRRSVALARKLGAGATAVGLLGVAEVHRQRGQEQQARAAYVEAVALARQSQERQVLVPALAGAARMDAGTLSHEARPMAEEAVRLATDSTRPTALTALGWVTLAEGDRPSAAGTAREAVEAARRVQALDLLAEALELAAACAPDASSARAALGEALTIWRDGGAEPAVARLQVLLGGLDDADASVRARARAAQRRLDQWGVNGTGLPVAVRVERTVRVTVLGGFGVTVEGAPVPHTAWRSRQARTLVKILAARRGRPVSRDRLCELLWPDDDPARTGHRLSVLLTTLRGVLDPGKQRPAEWYVAADLDRVWLDPAHCGVDADDLIRDAAHAARLIDARDKERAAEVLADVDARYTGDAFEDEQGEEWADALREEARAAWTRSVRSLVTVLNRSGRVGHTHGLLVRLLAADPYDEQAHRLLVRMLVRTGRHGEARRAFRRWAEAMRAIDAPPPDPTALREPLRAGRSRPDLVLTPR